MSSASPGSNGSAGRSSSQAVVLTDDDGIDLHDIVATFWGGKWIIVIITAIVLALALIYAFLATPIYQANALIQIEQQQNRALGANADVLSMLLPVAAPTQAEIAIMKSRSVLGPTVEKEHLATVIDGGDVPRNASGKPAVVISELTVPSAWMGKELTLTAQGNGGYTLASPSGDRLLEGHVDDVAKAGNERVSIQVERLNVPAGKEFSVKRLYDQQAIKDLGASFSAVEQGQETGVVELTLQGPHPVKTKNILNTLANQYIKQNVAAQATQARQSLVFINKQLPKVKHTLDTAQAKLTKYRTTKGVVNLDEQAKSLLDSLTNLESQLTQVKLTRSSMSQRFTGSYPGLQGLKSQQHELNSQISAVKAQIGKLPAKEKDYVSLLQKVQVYQQLYTALLGKSQDLQITQAATTGSARIVDYAVTPIKPIKPRKSLIGVLGLILGLFLGVLAVFLRRALSRAVEDASELESEFGLPVYAVVPHSGRQSYLMKKSRRKSDGRIPVLAIDAPDDPTVEAIRSLRTSLNFTLQGKERKIVTVGGCTPGVGKSFLSINLAHVIGAAGPRVLLVDADLRRGYLEKYMGVSKQPGLAQVLSGDIEIGDAIQPNPLHDNVDFLPTGPYPSNPYELFSSPRFEDILTEYAGQYEVVLVDVPPLLSVAEGLLVSRFSTVNFLAVKAGVQTLQEVRVAVDRMQQNGVRVDGFIFNNLTRQAQRYTYGHYAKRYYYTRADKGKK